MRGMREVSRPESDLAGRALSSSDAAPPPTLSPEIDPSVANILPGRGNGRRWLLSLFTLHPSPFTLPPPATPTLAQPPAPPPPAPRHPRTPHPRPRASTPPPPTSRSSGPSTAT